MLCEIAQMQQEKTLHYLIYIWNLKKRKNVDTMVAVVWVKRIECCSFDGKKLHITWAIYCGNMTYSIVCLVDIDESLKFSVGVNLYCSHHTHRWSEMGILISVIMVITSQWICTSKQYIVCLKYVQVSLVSYIEQSWKQKNMSL